MTLYINISNNSIKSCIEMVSIFTEIGFNPFITNNNSL